MEIRRAHTGEDYETVHRLFEEYEREIQVELCFQDFEKEMAELAERYGGERNGILIAKLDGEPCGCCAFRDLGDGIAEARRMYLRPGNRGKGNGRLLLDALIEEVRSAGYRAIRLHTLPTMEAAYAMYCAAGFTAIDPYEAVPPEAARFMELKLTQR